MVATSYGLGDASEHPVAFVLVCEECGQLSLLKVPQPGEEMVILGCDDPVLHRAGSVEFPREMGEAFLEKATALLRRLSEPDPFPVDGDDEDPFGD